MENKPPSLRSKRVCRFCLTESEPLSFIYERDMNKPFQVPLPLQIMSCVAIEVYASDGLPQMICNTCRRNLDRSYKFKLQCKKADEALRAYSHSGVFPRPLQAISYDASEVSGKRPSTEQRQANSDAPKKTRLDNGERRQQLEKQQQQRDKVDRHDFYEQEDGEGASESEQNGESKQEHVKLERGEIRVHACDQCERTFPLRQALALHVLRAHRDRNYKCTECERMFFSKYDLAKHMTTHSEEKPYSCAICHKQFSRANLLQRHERQHRDELRFACSNCDLEFFTSEELQKHEEAVHKKEKPFQCNICNKRFSYKQGLERHEMLHSEDKTFVCEYCKEAFRTSTKLARHLTTHAGHRPYLCKLCPRTFLLSHHLTRHMRTHSIEKHHTCEDCGKAFKRKESLEVHQLTHSKRGGMGLTCNVCKESCRNRADYVTHIKQHIEAGEKLGPDGLQAEGKSNKIDLDFDEEEEEDDEQYSDRENDSESTSYSGKKMSRKSLDSEEEEDEEEEEEAEAQRQLEMEQEREERMEKEECNKEQVIYIKGKDGNLMKKTIKTLMPIQRREILDAKPKSTNNATGASAYNKSSPTSKSEEQTKNRVEEADGQVQKLVASVFNECRATQKQQNVGQDACSSNGQTVNKLRDEKVDTTSNTKPANTVKVVKRILMRKPVANSELPTISSVTKDLESSTLSGGNSSNVAHRVTKRVIVRRIIRQGDTTREVIMNPDGSALDPSELARLPAGNIVKRVIVKKPVDRDQGSGGQTECMQPFVAKTSDLLRSETTKFELKTSQSSSQTSGSSQKSSSSATIKEDKETKEKLEQLERRLEQQRLKIEELQARKQQEYDTIDEMLPERHDESEDEQQLPLKRVFVKRKQSLYDEEQEYDDENDMKPPTTEEKGKESEDKGKTVKDKVTRFISKFEEMVKLEEPSFSTSCDFVTSTPLSTTRRDGKQPVVTSSKVYTNKKIVMVKQEEAPIALKQEETSIAVKQEQNSIAVKQEQNSIAEQLSQESNVNNLDSMDSLRNTRQSSVSFNFSEEITTGDRPTSSSCDSSFKDFIDSASLKSEAITKGSSIEKIGESESSVQLMITINDEADSRVFEIKDDSTEKQRQPGEDQQVAVDQQEVQEEVVAAVILDGQDLFDSSVNALANRKDVSSLVEDSVIMLQHNSSTITLTDTNDSQEDSLEAQLSRMEG